MTTFNSFVGVQHFHRQERHGGRHPPSPFPIFTLVEGKAVVLRQQERSENLGQVCQCLPQEVLPSKQDQCPAWEDFELPTTIRRDDS